MLVATALAIGLSVNVAAAPEISPTLIVIAEAEADAIWHNTGLTFTWSREPAPIDRAGRPSTTLRVVIDRNTRAPNDGGLPLGWIVFEDGRPREPEIFLSYGNAERLLAASRGVVGVARSMPLRERDTLLGRALGRALAHEMGHYLLASKAHSSRGLMQARRSAFEFFAAERRQFTIDLPNRTAVVARWRTEGGGSVATP